MQSISYGGRLTRAIVPAALVSLMACSGITDTLLEATDPDIINPAGVNSIEGGARTTRRHHLPPHRHHGGQ